MKINLEVITKLVHQRWVTFAALLLLVGSSTPMAQKILGVAVVDGWPGGCGFLKMRSSKTISRCQRGHVEATRRVDIGGTGDYRAQWSDPG
jgi:hypothetical protein